MEDDDDDDVASSPGVDLYSFPALPPAIVLPKSTIVDVEADAGEPIKES